MLARLLALGITWKLVKMSPSNSNTDGTVNGGKNTNANTNTHVPWSHDFGNANNDVSSGGFLGQSQAASTLEVCRIRTVQGLVAE